MVAETNAGLGLESDDSLPWLEPAQDYADDGEVSPTRLLVMVLGGLLLIGAVLGGLWWVQNGGARGQGELIAAQKGDYKVVPKNDASRTFEGEGDASFAASEGAEPASRVDASRMPEEPAVTPAEQDAAARAAVKRPAAEASAASARSGAAPAAKAETKSDAKADEKPSAIGGATIQLGAFSSEGAAGKAWTSLSKRFAYLADHGRTISPTQSATGTVYRLRVSAGSSANAAKLCEKLRVAGENCVVVR